MIISEEKADGLLTSETNLAISMRRERPGAGNSINHENAGRNEGDTNLSPAMRSIIAAAGHLSTAREVAENFNVSPGHAHNLKHGRLTPEGETKEEVLAGRNDILSDIRAKAADLILESLGLISPTKLAKLDPKELAATAKDLSQVLDKATPKETEKKEGTKILIITVPQKTLADYKVVEAIPIEATSGSGEATDNI